MHADRQNQQLERQTYRYADGNTSHSYGGGIMKNLSKLRSGVRIYVGSTLKILIKKEQNEAISVFKNNSGKFLAVSGQHETEAVPSGPMDSSLTSPSVLSSLSSR